MPMPDRDGDLLRFCSIVKDRYVGSVAMVKLQRLNYLGKVTANREGDPAFDYNYISIIIGACRDYLLCIYQSPK